MQSKKSQKTVLKIVKSIFHFLGVVFTLAFIMTDSTLIKIGLSVPLYVLLQMLVLANKDLEDVNRH